VRALQATGPDLTRSGLIRSFEAMGNVDLGGFRASFSPQRRQGSDFVELTFMVGRDGAFIH